MPIAISASHRGRIVRNRIGGTAADVHAVEPPGSRLQHEARGEKAGGRERAALLPPEPECAEEGSGDQCALAVIDDRAHRQRQVSYPGMRAEIEHEALGEVKAGQGGERSCQAGECPGDEPTASGTGAGQERHQQPYRTDVPDGIPQAAVVALDPRRGYPEDPRKPQYQGYPSDPALIPRLCRIHVPRRYRSSDRAPSIFLGVTHQAACRAAPSSGQSRGESWW